MHPDDPFTHPGLVSSLPSHLFLSGRPKCDSMFAVSEIMCTLREGAGDTALPQRSRHLSVLNCRVAVLEREKQSVPDVPAEHCPGVVSADLYSITKTNPPRGMI